jgi:TatD DNase family protein
MRLVDHHCHLTDERLLPEAGEILDRAAAAGVVGIVTVATHPDDTDAALPLCADREGLWTTAGVHPHEATRADEEALDRVERLLLQPRVVAVGETGLDYFYDHAPRDRQRRSFERHLELGARHGLPVVVHSRNADEDTAAMIRQAGPGVRGVLHCFSGRRPLLEAALDVGWFVSFAGMITFSRYEDADLLRSVPAERILVETDSPYLAPIPHRGKRNEPAYAALVARRAAELRGEDPEAFAAATLRNVVHLYALDLPDA